MLLQIVNRMDRILKSHGVSSAREFEERREELCKVYEGQFQMALNAASLTPRLENEQVHLSLMPTEIASALYDYRAAEKRLKRELKAAKARIKPMNSSVDEISALYDEACSMCTNT